MPTVKIRDINLYYEIHGQGKPIVIIMGLALDISEMTWLIDLLAKDHKVLAFDNRGAGKTDKPDSPYSIEMMAEDTVGLMDKLDIRNADILGISMGGRIALELTLKNPGRVNKLILVSSSARVTKTLHRFLVFNVLHRLPLLRGKQPHYAFVRQMKASSSYDAAKRLSEIHAPTLIMNGGADKLAPYQLAIELHDGIEDSKLITFRGGHLFFMFRERQAFTDSLSHWLN